MCHHRHHSSTSDRVEKDSCDCCMARTFDSLLHSAYLCHGKVPASKSTTLAVQVSGHMHQVHKASWRWNSGKNRTLSSGLTCMGKSQLDVTGDISASRRAIGAIWGMVDIRDPGVRQKDMWLQGNGRHVSRIYEC